MRLIVGHSEYMIRLGWLRVIARFVGDSPLSRDLLVKELQKIGTKQWNAWRDAADLAIEPRGAYSDSTVTRFIKFAEAYGVYDSQTEQLTPLGKTLFQADLDSHQDTGYVDSPFVWTSSMRYVGLRIVLGADGDLILEVLRTWPAERVLREPLDVIRTCTRNLQQRTKQEEHKKEIEAILELTTAASEEKKKAYWRIVYPLLEPLRELGYLQRVRDASNTRIAYYHLADVGERLRATIASGTWATTDATKLIESGLARIFIHGEGLPDAGKASPEALRATLEALPSMFLGGSGVEAPLEPVVLLTQTRLSRTSPGVWLEYEDARDMLRELGRVTEARIGLKQGRMQWESNVFWTERPNLSNASLWQIDKQVSPTPPSNPPTADTHTSYNSPPSAGAPPVGQAHTASMAQPSPRLLFWLQYLGRLFEPPTLGGDGAFRAGGPASWIARMQRLTEIHPKYLNGKRLPDGLPWSVDQNSGPRVPATHHLARFCEEFPGVPACEPFRYLLSAWGDLDTRVPLLHRQIERAQEKTQNDVPDFLLREIESFLSGSPKSDEFSARKQVCIATAALFEDVIDASLLQRENLRRILHREAARGINGITAITLVPPSHADQPMVVERVAKVPRAMVDYVRSTGSQGVLSYGPRPDGEFDIEIELKREPSESGSSDIIRDRLRIGVRVDAASRDVAIVRAWEAAWEALKNLGMLSGVASTSHLDDDDGISLAEDSPIVFAEDMTEIAPPEPFDAHAWLDPIPVFKRIHENAEINWDQSWQLSQKNTHHRHDETNAAMRLARTNHWLTAADQAGLRVPQRLSNVWVAVEHLIVEPDDEYHGQAVARVLADVGAFCHLGARGGVAARDLCEALRRANMFRGSDQDVRNQLLLWQPRIEQYLGTDVWKSIVAEPRDSVPVRIADRSGLKMMLDHETTDLKALADLVEDETPYAAFTIRWFAREVMGPMSDFCKWVCRIRNDIQSLVLHAYEIRNQLFHDGATFGVADGARIQNIYARFRMLVDAVAMRFAETLLESPDATTSAVWAELRVSMRDILCSYVTPGRAKNAAPEKNVDPKVVWEAVAGRRGNGVPATQSVRIGRGYQT